MNTKFKTRILRLGIVALLGGLTACNPFSESSVAPVPGFGEDSAGGTSNGGGSGVEAGTTNNAVLGIYDGSTYSFGNVVQNETEARTLIVRNLGDAAATYANLTTGSLGLAGAYTLNGGTCVGVNTLAAGASCTLIIDYTPTTLAVHTATITFTYNNGVTNKSATQNLTGTGVEADATQLEVAAPGAPASIEAGTCSNAFTVTMQDSTAATQAVANIRTVYLTAAGAADFFSDAACTTDITSLSFAVGEDTKSFYILPRVGPATVTVRATATLANGLATDTDNYAIIASSATNTLAYAKSPSTTAMTGIALATQPRFLLFDNAGAVVNTNNQATITVYASAGDCSTKSNALAGILNNYQVNASAGFVEFTNFNIDAASGTYYIRATLNTVDSSCKAVTVTRTATHLALTGPASVAADACSSVFTVTSKDPGGTTTNVTADTTVNLTSDGTLSFYSAADCSGGTITSVDILDATSSATFYAKSTVAGQTINVTAAATLGNGATNTSESLSTTASVTLAGLSIVSGDAQSDVPSAVLGTAFTVEATDSNGSPISGVTINWRVVQGGGSLSVASSVTDALGRASSTLTLGAATGHNMVSATSGGYAVRFTAQATDCTAPMIANTPFAAGSGTLADPYLICTTTQLNQISTDPNYNQRHYKLASDLNYGAAAPTMIGSSGVPFRGSFNGAGHTISNFAITAAANDVGLFRYTADARIFDLTLKDITIAAASYQAVGALVGYSARTSVNNIRLSGTNTITGGGYTGAILGRDGSASQLQQIDVSSGTTVSGTSYVGGIVGELLGSLTHSMVRAAVNVSSLIAGGAIGNMGGGRIFKVGATGNVSASANNVYAMGGLAGVGTAQGVIDSSYATGTVSQLAFTGVYRCGGLIGYSFATIFNSYARGNVYCGNETGGFVGYTGNNYYVNNYATGIVSNVSGSATSSTAASRHLFIGTGGSINTSSLGNFWNSTTANEPAGAVTEPSSTAQGFPYVRPLTSDELKNTSLLAGYGYDFVRTWRAAPTYAADPNYNAGFPILQWQMPIGDQPSIASLFAGGDGSQTSPFQIATANQLANIGWAMQLATSAVGAHYKLTANINFASAIAPRIGTSALPFTGSFDGGGYTISNFVVNATNTNSGLFGYTSGATIRNLQLSNFRVCGSPTVSGACSTTLTSAPNSLGGLVGYALRSRIETITVTGTNNVYGFNYVGLLVGTASHSSISHVHISGTNTAYGDRGVGGVVGYASWTILRRLLSNSTVYANTRGGGIAGELDGEPPELRGLGATGNVYGTTNNGGNLGGLLGYQNTGWPTVIQDSFATGAVTKDPLAGALTLNYCGGLIGLASATIYNSYAKGAVTCTNYVGGLAGYAYYAMNSFSIGAVSGSSNNHPFLGQLGGTASQTQTDQWTVNGCYGNFWNSDAVISGGSGSSAVPSNSQCFTGVQPTTGANLKQAHLLASRGYNFNTVWRAAPSDPASPYYNDGYPSHQWWDPTFTRPTVESYFAAGNGSEAAPFLISTPQQLANVPLAIQLSERARRGYYQVTADLDMTGIPAPTIGYATTASPLESASTASWWHIPFQGVFDGGNHTISNLTFVTPSNNSIGLFGFIHGATVRDVHLSDVTLAGTTDVAKSSPVFNTAGLLVGYAEQSIIDSISITGTNTLTAGNDVGAVAGALSSTRMTRVSVAAGTTVTGRLRVGGLVGRELYSTVAHATTAAAVNGWLTEIGGAFGYGASGVHMNISATGAVNLTQLASNGGWGGMVGGFVGNNDNAFNVSLSRSTGAVTGASAFADVIRCGGFTAYLGTITDSYATGNVTCKSYGGGFSGQGGSFTRVYATGSVTGGTSTGGIAPTAGGYGASCTNCFWDTDTSGQASSGGGTGKTTVEMQTATTFSTWSTNYWNLVDGAYPTVRVH